MTSNTPPSPELFFANASAYQQTAALRAAIELEIFTAIGDGAGTVPAIAAQCKASERGTRILCDYLTIMGFLIKTDGTYRLTPDSTVFLSKRSPAYLGGTLEFLAASDVVRHFDDLASTVRRGAIEKSDSTVADENPVWQKFARAMMPMMMMPAQAMADILGAAGAGPIKVLDIAAGHGIFGIVIAQRNPQAEVVAVDWAGVLTVAAENAAKMGVAARHKNLPGDAFKVDFGAGYDVALMTNFLHASHRHLHGAADEVAAALKPGGRIAILGSCRTTIASPPGPASFAIRCSAEPRSATLYVRRTQCDAEGRRLRLIPRTSRPGNRRRRSEIAIGFLPMTMLTTLSS